MLHEKTYWRATEFHKSHNYVEPLTQKKPGSLRRVRFITRTGVAVHQIFIFCFDVYKIRPFLREAMWVWSEKHF